MATKAVKPSVKPKAKPKLAPAKRAPNKAKAKLTPARVAAHAKGRVKRVNEGRPTKWKPEFVELAYKFCLMGATDRRLGEFFGVDEWTINKWKDEYPEFSQSIYDGREKADADIAHSLYHRAKGYSHEEDDIRTIALGGNQGSELVITRTVKHYPPDTVAASLWLRNRQRHLWRDKLEVEHGGRVSMEQLPDEELKSMLLELNSKLGLA